MAVEVAWFTPERRILQYSFLDRWTWDEYFMTLAVGQELQKRVNHMTCTLNNMSQTAYLPGDFLEKARSINLTRPLNTGIAIYVSSDPHLRSIYEILCRLYPDVMPRYPLAATMKDALVLINDWFIQYDGDAPAG